MHIAILSDVQVKPKNPPEITPEDLAACGMSGTFFSVLSDVKQFFDYNYREVREALFALALLWTPSLSCLA